MTHQLPPTISFRHNPQKTIKQSHINALLTYLLVEIAEQKKIFTDFIVIKDQDFNYKKNAGALVLRFKKYPFVVKLFLETPRSWVRPYNKGIEAICQHIIGGGVSRHLCGFTRIKNLEWVQNKLKTNPLYATTVDMPRKWFWLPQHAPFLRVTGYNIGGHKKISQTLPALYAIVEDAIDVEKTFSMRNYNDRKTAIDLSNFLEMHIDAHINNFVYEKKTNKIIIIDTELFPVLVGLKKPMHISNYASYYLKLVKKAFLSFFFSSKKDRKKRQLEAEPPYGLLN